MIPFLLTLIENVWIITAIIIVLCLISLKIFGKALGTVAKIVILVLVVASILIALGLTTSAELKELAVQLVSEMKDFSTEDYKDIVNENSSAEQFVK